MNRPHGSVSLARPGRARGRGNAAARGAVLTVLLGGVALVASLLVMEGESSAECPGPVVVVEPAETSAGQHVHVSGENFARECDDIGAEGGISDPVEGIELRFEQGERSTLLKAVDADADFEISTVVLLPEDAGTGEAVIRAAVPEGEGTTGPPDATARIVIRESGRPTGRVAGGDRVATAVEVSRRAFPDGAAVAYLARADLPTDAIAGGTLRDGPVLLVPSCGDVPPVVVEEIARLRPGQILTLGGAAAVCDDLLQRAAAS